MKKAIPTLLTLMLIVTPMVFAKPQVSKVEEPKQITYLYAEKQNQLEEFDRENELLIIEAKQKKKEPVTIASVEVKEQPKPKALAKAEVKPEPKQATPIKKEVAREVSHEQQRTTLSNATVSRGGQPQVKGKEITVTATAYISFCDTGCIGKTATGIDVSKNITTKDGYGIVAVDPKVIPLHSTVIIDGKTYKAEDTGGDIDGHRIDILMGTHDDTKANDYGIHRDITIRVIPPVK